jgi:Ca2+/H+ antiporter
LIASVIAVVGVAWLLSPAFEERVKATGAPKIILGISIAMLVIVRERFVAVRADKNAIFRVA